MRLDQSLENEEPQQGHQEDQDRRSELHSGFTSISVSLIILINRSARRMSPEAGWRQSFAGGLQCHIEVMKILNSWVLARELARIVDGDRYLLSSRIRTLRAVLGKLRPQPARPVASP